MTTTKSLVVAALLTSVAAVSFAQAPAPSTGSEAPSAPAATAAHHKKHHHHHRHHHHHAHHETAAAKTMPAGK